MKTSEIIRALQNIDCDTCEHDPTCNHGNMCVIVQEACERLALLEKEKKACFRLGQMDMRASVVALLETTAGKTIPIVSATLLASAAQIRHMVVNGHD